MTEPDLPADIAALVDDLAGARGVVAVVLGGSRASRDADAFRDWDLALVYRGAPDLAALAARGTVHPPGSWGRIRHRGGARTPVRAGRVGPQREAYPRARRAGARAGGVRGHAARRRSPRLGRRGRRGAHARGVTLQAGPLDPACSGLPGAAPRRDVAPEEEPWAASTSRSSRAPRSAAACAHATPPIRATARGGAAAGAHRRRARLPGGSALRTRALILRNPS
jgi:hypothetical protein